MLVKAAEILNIGWGDQSEDIFQNSKIMKSCERLYVCNCVCVFNRGCKLRTKSRQFREGMWAEVI